MEFKGHKKKAKERVVSLGGWVLRVGGSLESPLWSGLNLTWAIET